MSIEVSSISKFYGEQKALNTISFSVDKGSVVGFLGPNGAGKSTMMKILTGYIEPNEGTVLVNGIDVLVNSIEAQKCIGYLPEHNPLYTEMYVKEYLQFQASIYRVSKNVISEIIEKVGLTPESHKKVGQLSKGYQQRVGLAAALLHNPEVLILDEPISGLDPNQLIEIRTLIKSLGNEKTVIFSSHIMQEVQALCDRITIINQGKLAADDTIDNLIHKSAEDYILQVEFDKPASMDSLASLHPSIEIQAKSDCSFSCRVSTTDDIRHLFFQYAINNQLVLLELHKKSPSVEDLFQKVTQ